MLVYSRNDISDLEDESSHNFKNTINTLFLGDNDLAAVPKKFFRYVN